MNKFDGLLEMAEEIRHDFEAIVTKNIPGYKESHRYRELTEMIEELKSGEVKAFRI